MEFEEFSRRVGEVRNRGLAPGYPDEIILFDQWRASEVDIQWVERELGLLLPAKYKEFMRRFGAGVFLFLDLLPLVSPDGRTEDLVTVNRESISGDKVDFVAVAPVGSGDWWGFVVRDGVCEEEVSFLDHETGRVSPYCEDFLDFLAREGLRVTP